MTPTERLLARVGRLSPEARDAFVASLRPAEAAVLADAVAAARRTRSRPTLKSHRPTHPDQRYQVPPDGPWRGWLFLGGRGAGKTQSVGSRFHDHMTGPPCIPNVPGGHRGIIVAPTLGDVSAACVDGPSGLKALDPAVRAVTRKGGMVVEFPNGSVALTAGAHAPSDVERLRAAGNSCIAWCEELAAWRQLGYPNDAWDLLQTGLRLGPRPQWMASTTPKPIGLLRTLTRDGLPPDHDGDVPARSVVLTAGSMWDNVDNLAPDFIATMEDLYGGTRVEAQELLGLLLDDVEGALWHSEALEDTRVAPDRLPDITRWAIGVDPNFSTRQDADEAGIIIAGLGTPPGQTRPHVYVTDDRSCRGAMVWPQRAVEVWRELAEQAGPGRVTIVVEANLGGKDWITKMVGQHDQHARVKPVTARKGKQLRAEPAALLWDQGRGHMVGSFPLLERELTSWTPGDDSPNRLDALVWAVEHLLPSTTRRKASGTGPAGRGRVPRRPGR